MSDRKNLTPLVGGLLLVAVGLFLFLERFYDFDILWFEVLRLALPAFFLYLGLSKLIRHFAWDADQLQHSASRSSLLGGLFWTSVGLLILMDMLGVLSSLDFFALYWPLLLVFFGLGKVIDFYRLKGRMQFRGGEIVGLILFIFFGLFCTAASEAHWPLINLGWPDSRDWELGFPGQGPSYRWTDTQAVPASGLTGLRVSNLYGDVVIEGNSNQDSIEIELTKVVRERFESNAQEIADQIQLSADRQEATLEVGTNRGELNRDYRFQTHISIRLPRNLQVRAVNGYGTLQVSNVSADCDLENERGDLRAEFITGDVKLKNRFDAVVARHIEGKLNIENRRGTVRIEETKGDAEVVTERKSVAADAVEGNLTVRNYHGTVRLSNISGPVNVEALGSSIHLSNLEQKATVSNSYQHMTAVGLKAGLELKTEHSQVRLTNVEGAVDIEPRRADITATGLRSGITVRGSSSSVSISDSAGPVEIVTSLQLVRLEQFQGPVTVQNQNGEIQITSDQPLSDPLTAENSNGSITVSLPSASNFSLTAVSEGGSIISDFGRQRSQGQDEVLQATVGSGGPQVNLQTKFAPIRIHRIG